MFNLNDKSENENTWNFLHRLLSLKSVSGGYSVSDSRFKEMLSVEFTLQVGKISDPEGAMSSSIKLWPSLQVLFVLGSNIFLINWFKLSVKIRKVKWDFIGLLLIQPHSTLSKTLFLLLEHYTVHQRFCEAYTIKSSVPLVSLQQLSARSVLLESILYKTCL